MHQVKMRVANLPIFISADKCPQYFVVTDISVMSTKIKAKVMLFANDLK